MAANVEDTSVHTRLYTNTTVYCRIAGILYYIFFYVVHRDYTLYMFLRGKRDNNSPETPVEQGAA